MIGMCPVGLGMGGVRAPGQAVRGVCYPLVLFFSTKEVVMGIQLNIGGFCYV